MNRFKPESSARSLFRLAFTGLVFAMSALPSTAHAFIFLAGGAYEKGERPISAVPVWPKRVLRFYVNTNLDVMGGSLPTSVTGAQLLLAVEAAVGAWTQACRADLQIEVAGTTSGIYNPSDGMNTILWDDRSFAEGNYYGNDTSILAAATSVVAGEDFADCDIVLNGNASTAMAYAPAMGQADLRSVVTHEVGHCIGLDHPIEPDTGTPANGYDSAETFLREATMVQTVTLADPSDTSRRDINQDDRDGIECIYERGRPLRTGSRCDSYTGTNNSGTIIGRTAITGGPTGTDTNCGTDSQGRNARPSTTAGDGCISSAIARTGSGPTPPPAGFLDRIGGSFGFLLFAAMFFLGRFLRRSLRRSARSAIVAAIGIALFLSAPVKSARAWELELHYERRSPSPKLWESFAAMDSSSGAQWDRDPSAVKFGSLSEITATAYSEFESWGKWGAFLAVSLPKSVSTNAKAQNAADQTKTTTLGGFRVGPDVRWYPVGVDGVRWFVGGRLGAGLFTGNQEFESSAGGASSGKVSYRAWSFELAASTGVEFPVGPVALVAEGGYSRLRSSYFSSTGNEGSVYSDFPSGTRLAADTGSQTEDVRFIGSGLYARIGVQIALGGGDRRSTRPEEPAYDDYEGSPTREEPRPADAPVEEKIRPLDRTVPEAPAKPAPAPAPAPDNLPSTPPSESVPLPSALEDPMQREREFQDSIRPAPKPSVAAPAPKPITPDPVATPAAPPVLTPPATKPSAVPPPPLVPRKRETWEIDPIPGEIPPLDEAPVLPAPPAAAPNRPDPVP